MALLDKDGLSYFWSKIKEKHINKKDNPHDVTKAQVGLGDVLNVASYSKTETDTKLKDYVTKNDLSTKVETQVAKIGDSKVWIGVNNESGFVNIRNVAQGSDAIMWRLDTWHNQLRFVRNSETVPAYITEKGIYGAKFNFTGLFSGEVNNRTITLDDSLANYTFLFIKCQSASGNNTFRMISVDFLRNNQNLWISLGGDDKNGYPVFVQLKWSSETSLAIGLGRYGTVYSIDGV